MKQIAWKESAELIGISAIVASLVFVGIQLRQDRELAYAESTISELGYTAEIIGLIVSNSETWVRGLDGEELILADQFAFGAMARLFYRESNQRWSRNEILGKSSQDGVVRQYAFYIYQYPGLKRAFDEHAVQSKFRNDAFGRTSTGFRSAVRAAYEDLQERAPPIPPSNHILF